LADFVGPETDVLAPQRTHDAGGGRRAAGPGNYRAARHPGQRGRCHRLLLRVGAEPHRPVRAAGEVQRRLRSMMTDAAGAVFALAEDRQIDLRTAAYALALRRLGAAI